MKFDDLNEGTFLMYAMKEYNNIQCTNIEEFHDDLKTVLNSAFKKHNTSLDASKMFSSNDDDSEIPAFIAEHQKKQKNKKR